MKTILLLIALSCSALAQLTPGKAIVSPSTDKPLTMRQQVATLQSQLDAANAELEKARKFIELAAAANARLVEQRQEISDKYDSLLAASRMVVEENGRLRRNYKDLLDASRNLLVAEGWTCNADAPCTPPKEAPQTSTARKVVGGASLGAVRGLAAYTGPAQINCSSQTFGNGNSSSTYTSCH